MLVLSRKPGERIFIGDEIKVTLIRVGPNACRIGIEAPDGMNVVREELASIKNMQQLRDFIAGDSPRPADEINPDAVLGLPEPLTV